MFQIWTGNYVASLEFQVFHKDAKEVFGKIAFPEYVNHHFDYFVRLEQYTLDPYGSKLKFRIRMEQAFKDQPSFVEMTKRDFIPAIQGYINYVLTVLYKYDPIVDWGTYYFEILNMEKVTGMSPMQSNHGGPFYNRVESTYNMGNYLDSGIMPKEGTDPFGPAY